MSGSAGMGFTPHIITVAVGEDIARKIMAFSQQGLRGRAICIFSVNGAVSTVTLSQPSTPGGTVIYEGHFEILSLSGSYLPTDGGGSRNRTGGLSVSLSSPDGRVIGGAVGGVLIAANEVQVILGSFIYGGSRTKRMRKEVSEGAEVAMESDHQAVQNSVTPTSSLSPRPASRPLDMRNSHIDIDYLI